MLNTSLLLIAFAFCGHVAIAQPFPRDTVKVWVFAYDTTQPSGRPALGIQVLEVREWHNSSEGMIDPGFCLDCKFVNYPIHIKYLTFRKEEFPKKYLLFKPKQDDE